MHYRDGKEVKLGDLAKGKPDWPGHEVIGAVVGRCPGAETCNITLKAVYRAANDALPDVGVMTCNAKDFELVARAVNDPPEGAKAP